MGKIKLSIILLLVSVLSVSCSGGSTPDEKMATTEKTVETTAEEEVSAYVSKYIESDDVKNIIEKAKAQGIDIAISAEGTSIKYKNTYLQSFDKMGGSESFVAGLEDYLNNPEARSGMKSVLEIEKQQCQSIASFIYEYYDSDGNFITSTEIE